MTAFSRAMLPFTLALGFVLLPDMAVAQLQDKSSVFSKTPTATAPNAREKRRLLGARTYADRQRILKQQKNARKSAPAKPGNQTSVLNKMQDKQQAKKGAAPAGRAFGPRQRVRADSQIRGGKPVNSSK